MHLSSTLLNRLRGAGGLIPEDLKIIDDETVENSPAYQTWTDALTWICVIVEIVLMATLLIISTTFLYNSCHSQQKTARFIIKLLVLVSAVAVTGIINALHSAPWWQEESAYFDKLPDIIVTCISEFIYWCSAQWSTWIIAFQFYSTSQQMKKVDKHFSQKFERRRNMTEAEIQEEKQKKFLTRQKEKIFGLVDHLDTLKNSMTLSKIDEEVKGEPDSPVTPQEQQQEERNVNRINVYRKRLNRWKNIGVMFVFVSVGCTILTTGVLRYDLNIDETEYTKQDLKSWITMGLVFGGLNIICQVVACCIMLSATLTMKNLTQKNSFNAQLKDIRMNMVVSSLICIGYIVQYSVDTVMAVLILLGKVNPDFNSFILIISKIFLTICIFTAYMVLLKIFLTYQRQIDDISKKQEVQKAKAEAKAAKKELEKQEHQAISGESGQTPSHNDVEEPFLNSKSIKTGINNEEDDEDYPDQFLIKLKTNSLSKTDRIDSIKTVIDEKISDNVSEDSFCTDSSGDSILDNSFDHELNPADRALQTQIMSNFVHVYKKGFEKTQRSFFMRQETQFATFSPSNAGRTVASKTEIIVDMASETEEISDISDDESNFSVTPKGKQYRPASKVIDYDDISL